MTSLEARFEAKVDRSGDHHLWTGATRPDGAGHLKVGGKPVLARRVAWELARGTLPAGVEVVSCAEHKGCVNVAHLKIRATARGVAKPRRRAAAGAGSKEEIRPGVWKLTVGAGYYADGRRRREFKTVHADSEREATKLLADFVTEVENSPLPDSVADRDITVDAAIDRYLDEHLADEKGRSTKTVKNYRQIHRQWFSPVIGTSRVRDVEEATMDRIFGKMRKAGVSRARMNTAVSLYRPFFQWAKSRRIVRRSPVADFKMPTSTQVKRKRVPPEVEEVCLLLDGALAHTPDIAPVLALAAVTGMRRGELVVIRRSTLRPARLEMLLDEAADDSGTKATKTGEERLVALDQETMDMLLRHCELMDDRAREAGVEIEPWAFVFSREVDCSRPMPADHLTKRVAVLKDHLGIPDKQPETIKRESEALRLFREPRPRPAGRPGPRPKGGMSYAEIGMQLGRSEKWAILAVAAAERREAAALAGDLEFFDGSILGLRRFTSSELMDAGFNMSAVADRQGHSPQVLMNSYSRGRRSANHRAADFLGRRIHRDPDAPASGELECPGL